MTKRLQPALRFMRSRWDLAALSSALLAMFLLRRGLPPGIVLLGAISGLFVGLNALGVILVYRSSRVINFAQLAFGTVAAVWFFLWSEHLQWIVVLHRACQSCVPWLPAHSNLQEHGGLLLQTLLHQANDLHNGWAAFLLAANFWISVVLALALATSTGSGIGWVITRFWKDAPRLIPTVALLGQGLAISIGAAAALGLRSFKIDNLFGWRFHEIKPFFWWPYDEISPTGQANFLQGGLTGSGGIYTPFPNATFHLNGVPFPFGFWFSAFLVCLVFAAVYLYYRFARAGVVIRGLSENADRAKALGIDADRLVSRTWGLAGLIGGLGGVLLVLLQGAGFLTTVSANAFDLGALAAALAVAVFGRLSSFGRALFASAALGVITQAMYFNFNTTSAYDGLLVGILAVALLLQTSRATRAEQESALAWLASPEIRPTPRELRRLPVVSNWIRGGLVLLAIVVIGLPWVTDPGQLVTGTTVLTYVILGLSLLLLTGWAGQVSIGQVALAAVGGYVAVDLAVNGSVPLPLALVAAGLAAAVAAVIVGVPALRLRGPYLVVITLVFSVGITDTLLNPSLLGGRLPVGFTRPLLLGLDLSDEHVMYYTALGVLALAIAGLMGLKRSRTRRALIAARDNEPATQVFGVNVVWTRLEGFAVSGFVAGLAGALLAIETHGVRAITFSPALSVLVFLMIVIGGAGSLAGPVIGGGYLAGFSLLGAGWADFAMGSGAYSLLLLAPGGLGSLFFKARDSTLRRIAIRNRISVPSLMADFSRSAEGVVRARILPKRRGDGGTEFVPVLHRLVGPGPGPVEGTWLGAHADGDGKGRLEASRLVADSVTSALLSCRRVEVHYDQAQALFGVDFEVGAGEIVALVGTNGAGKTTLLRAIAGLHPASAGAITFDGKDITRTAAYEIGKAGIITVPGGGGVFPSLTVEENLRVARWADPVGSGERVEKVLLAFPRLRERLGTRAGNLSGGEQQMLALAQAFVVQPRLLMIDELSLGLSPQIVQIILDLLRQMRDSGTAIIVVEQSLNLTLTIAERAYVLEKGEVRYSGSARQLVNHPELFAAISFGSASAGVAGGSEMARRRREIGEIREIALAVVDVRTSYGGVIAVDGVTLEVAAGEVVGVIGPNGAGKTTLFDIISGFQPAEQGSVLLFGADITRLSPSRRGHLGLQRSFQSVRLFPSLTVRDNIAVAMETRIKASNAAFNALWLPPARGAEKRVQTRVDQLIELMGLEEHQEKVMSELSTGTRRIVDIACQLAARPKVLLLDEPSSGLAQSETEELGPVISRVSKDIDCAVLIIEHDIALVSAVSQRLVAMDLGRAIKVGRPDEVVSDQRVRGAYFGGASEAVAQRSGQRPAVPQKEVVTV